MTVIVEPQLVVGAETASVLPCKSEGWSGVIVMYDDS